MPLDDAPQKKPALWRRIWSRLPRGPVGALQIVLAVVAALALGQLVLLFVLRVPYPFELEWMEGGIVDHVRIVLLGEPLYREPTLDFTPFIYPPFYYYVCAAVSRVFGVSLLVPRLVSSLAAVGNVGLIAVLVRREGGGLLAAIFASAVFALTFEHSGRWMDIARVDSLFVCLLLVTCLLARRHSMKAAAAAGAVLFLAFFTKQTGLTLAAPILASIVLRDRRQGGVSVGVFVVLVGSCILWMNHRTDGWFSWYVFTVPSQHLLRWDDWRPGLDGFWGPLVVPVLLALYAFCSGALVGQRPGVARFAPLVLHAGLVLAALATGYSSLLHADGFANVIMPYHAAIAVASGIGLGRVLRDEGATAAIGAKATVLVSVLLHFAVSAYDHRRALPSHADATAGRAMIERLRTQPGPVLMIGTGYYAMMAGHPEISAHTMALTDVVKMHEGPKRTALIKNIEDAIRSRRYRTIAFDTTWTFLPNEIIGVLRTYYRPRGFLFLPDEGGATWPRTGYGNRPNEVWGPL
jgi:hypothetical protein